MIGRLMQVIALIAILSFSAGCAATAERYRESYDVPALKVVFLDQQSLQDTYVRLYRSAPVHFDRNTTGSSVRSIRGFFDPATRTLYCSKMDFEICGHEMHHAVLGPFHPQ